MNYICLSESSQYYECGYSCDNGLFLNLGGEKFFITDGRYTIEAKEAIKNAEIVQSRDLYKSANKIIKKSKAKKVTIDPIEWNLLSYDVLSKDLKTEFIKEPSFSHKKRAVKTDEEISLLKTASKIGKESFKQIASILQSDLTEKELYYRAKSILEGYGEREVSFDPIFAINENTAKPHALPTKKKLKKFDLILLDAGVKYKRYCSDRTRVLEFGSKNKFSKEQSFNVKKRQKIYDIVLMAQEEAIKKAKPGMKAKDLDRIARDVIEKKGYGKYFVHSLGHGVGIDIHEYPFINSRNEMILEENMVFSIEPGIYLPDDFGVRIEDVVYLTSKGAEIL
ncbi:MAG: aminopeptidase P family protein [Campylobacterales bacterium]|nr:aminopeptidase P family protein [Campylobacterales bacterium]